MKYQIHSHRHGWEIVQNVPELAHLWHELEAALEGLTDEVLIAEFEAQQARKINPEATEEGAPTGSKMSLSSSINYVLDRTLKRKGWASQSALFQDEEYKAGSRWRLDFSKQAELSTLHSVETGASVTGIAVEVAFNHGEAIAWNLLKPVIAAELNHVTKETYIGSGVGVIICATEKLKEAGAFDSAVGSYEKFLRYLKPLMNQLTVPMLIVGLEAPETFKVIKMRNEQTKKNIGKVERI